MAITAPTTRTPVVTRGYARAAPPSETTAGLKRAVIYLRVSTTQQASRDGDPEGYSIPAQREACQRQAHDLDAIVVDEYVDAGESARSADRPQLQAMLQRLADGDIDYVIVHKVDRLARSREDDVMINLTIQQAGAELVSCSEAIDQTPSGVLVHGIMASIAEFYSRNLATEVAKGMGQKARRGGTTSKAPIGYVNVRAVMDGREVRTVAIDEERAPLVKWAFETYASGDWPLRQLVEELNNRGLTTRPTAKLPAKPLHLSHLQRILTNRYYAGIVSFKGADYLGQHEALIDLSLFEKVQRRLRSSNHAGERRRLHDHYLKGSLFCGRCGSRLSLMNAKGRHGGIYPYFFCMGRQRHNGCTLPYLRVDELEGAVQQEYAALRLSREQADAVRAAILRQAELVDELHARERKRHAKVIKRLERQREKLLEAFYADAIGVDQLKAEQKRISAELGRASRGLEDARADTANVEAALDLVLSLLTACELIYEKSSGEIRRLLNQAFFERLEVDTDRSLSAVLASPFAETIEHRAIRGRNEKNPGPDDPDQGSSKTLLVGEGGLEPPRPFGHRNLNPARLPNSATRPSGAESLPAADQGASIVAVVYERAISSTSATYSSDWL
jgi:site-specific DNA recombinase